MVKKKKSKKSKPREKILVLPSKLASEIDEDSLLLEEELDDEVDYD